ncbi:hypothetical protein BD324DRAFT_473195 [Kockovaella imperatae]|uniref:Uncharacterized protein n=1 Tax=Kockovaella imperatae TaxID=4999 RepID=A0A1Y1UH81_9TREE|nr:hypothetical protein BD324DRAFT_473195 [Kockovaella imperatae]ORX36846.1 hypothetical protein BD324DRAFT_473195 [Kockovaella imperatae]
MRRLFHSGTASSRHSDLDELHPRSSRSRLAGIKSRISRANPPVIGQRESSLYTYHNSTEATFTPTNNVSDLDTAYATATLRHVTQSTPYRPFGYYSSIDLGQRINNHSVFDLHRRPPLDNYEDDEDEDHPFDAETFDFPLPPVPSAFATRSLDILPLQVEQGRRVQYFSPPTYTAPQPSKAGRGRFFTRLRLPHFLSRRSKMTDAPPIPPRSEARRGHLQPPFEPRPMHHLPVDMPAFEDTPSLSSGSSSDHESPVNTPWSPEPSRKPSRESFLWGHKKNKKSQDLGKDPYRVRDGAEKIPPTSGVDLVSRCQIRVNVVRGQQ